LKNLTTGSLPDEKVGFLDFGFQYYFNFGCLYVMNPERANTNGNKSTQNCTITSYFRWIVTVFPYLYISYTLF